MSDSGGLELDFGTSAEARIRVTKARIGCLPIQRSGNLTRIVARSCNGKTRCSYKAPSERQYKRMGVRARTRSFCSQGMEILYNCGDRRTRRATVPGDAWKHGPAQLSCPARAARRPSRTGRTTRRPPRRPSHATRSRNPEATRILRDILKKYERCIIEKYETRQTARLKHRDRDKCANGRTCTRRSRANAWRQLQQKASAGDAGGFEVLLKSAVLGDCMECRKHRKWHTKHTHCTMDCGGNNGLFKGPCFEGCKAGVDITAFLRDVGKELRKHAQLFAGNFDGKGHERVAGSERNEHFGRTVATNRALITPRDHEHCDPRHAKDGFYVAPRDAGLLDWDRRGVEAPTWHVALTGYNPPKPPTRAQYNRGQLTNIGASEGRIRPDLRAVAKRKDPNSALCKSAIAFVNRKTSDGNALADLAVTGRASFAKFRRRPPTEAQILSCVKADRSMRGKSQGTLTSAVKKTLKRAYHVAQVLRAGGWPAACPERKALGYIAVSGEDDQPHRPVNIPSSNYAQYSLDVTVRGIKVRTRYIVAQVKGGGRSPSCRYQGYKVPRDPKPVLAKNAEVLLFIHGMDSRAEESSHLMDVLNKLGKVRGRNYAIIAMDLPSSGFATNLDYNRISPITAMGQATGIGIAFRPKKYHSKVLDFLEDFVVNFVHTLRRQLPNVTRQIKAVIGGSLGGNLSMRFGRPRRDAPWIKAVVPWSPAGMWQSKADISGEHIALATPWSWAGGQAEYRTEKKWSRNGLFYGNFDWQAKVLGMVKVTEPQSRYWWGDWWKCKSVYERTARVSRYETYSPLWRRWHWRLATEQMMFSHQNVVRGAPLYTRNSIRTLLMCGIQDTGGGLCENTRKVAAKMKYTPGHAIYLLTTGHSIHDERPNFLARHIADFIAPRTRGISYQQDVARTGRTLRRTGAASPAKCRDLCRRDRLCRAYSHTRPSRPTSQGQCTLLRDAGRPSVNPDAVSGLK